MRVSFGSLGTVVEGWPSKGGLYVLHHPNPASLSFLHLERFVHIRLNEDPALEDEFCSRLKMLGATYWPEEDMDYYWQYGQFGFKGIGHRHQTGVWIGWNDSGKEGVWVLKLNKVQAKEESVRLVENAATMEERCKVIEILGGTFFADPKDCPDTKSLVGDD